MFKIIKIIVLLPYLVIGSSRVFEFCADNQLFRFSYEACPGGVFIKNPMELTEPCHCINKHLTVYTTCMAESETIHYPPKACRRLGSRGKLSHEAVLVQLVQPFGDPNTFKDKDTKCTKLLRTCVSSNETSILQRLPQFDNHSPAREIESEYPHKLLYSPGGRVTRKTKLLQPPEQPHRQKRDMGNNHPLDMPQIQETIDFLTELQSGSGMVKKPKSMTFQLLARTVEIFNSIAPRTIIEDETTNSILSLFFKNYSQLEGPSYSGKLLIDDPLDKTIFDDIMSRLHECASKASDASQEFEFRTLEGVCPVVVTHVTDKVSRPDASVKTRELSLGDYMPQDRKYVMDNEDFLLGALWKIFDSVYSYCFPYLYSFHNAQALIYYFNYMENIFVSPFVVQDFMSVNVDGTSSYASRIEHDDLGMLMKNIDFMNEAVHLLGNFKPFLAKPSMDRPVASEPTGEAPILRKKRSIKNRGWKDLEIWGGRAYCLQTSNPYLQASIQNAYPNIEDFCA